MSYEKTKELERFRRDFPTMSPFVLLKLSMTVYGVVLLKRAMSKVQDPYYRFGDAEPFGIAFEGREKVGDRGATSGQETAGDQDQVKAKNMALPGPILLLDGSNVYINYGEDFADPYTIDWDPDQEVFVLMDGDWEVDHVDFVPRPAFYDKTTSLGTAMSQVAEARGQKLIMNAFQQCRLWEGGDQCHFCAFFTGGHTQGDVPIQDIRETVAEALKEPGRFSEIYLSGGTDFGGDPAFSTEIDRYIRVWQEIGSFFTERFSSQLMAPAYKKEDLQRIYDSTKITSYTASLEVWDKDLFAQLCPGKEKWIGRDEWVRRLVDAVDVFGPGKVSTQVVAGVELAQPHGFQTIDQALESNFEACDYFAKHGVVYLSSVWHPHRATRLGKQPMQDLSYYVRLAHGLHQIRQSYGLTTLNDNYKHCGNHADSDLERMDLWTF